MRIIVTVRARAKKNLVEKLDDTHFRVSTTAAPIDGKANNAVTRLIAEYFKVPSWTVMIESGARSKTKIISIDNV